MQFKANMVLFILGAVMTLAPLMANASDSEIWSARQRPAICYETFKDYRMAVRKCRGLGIIRRFDGWNFVGYGCDCSAYDEHYFPQRPDNLLPGDWTLEF